MKENEIPSLSELLYNMNDRINKLAEGLLTLNKQNAQLLEVICKLHHLDLEELKTELHSCKESVRKC